MPFVTEYLAEGAQLVLSGSAGVAEAGALQAALIELVPTPGCVTIDESRLSSYDITLLQLVLAFVKARRDRGADVAVVDGPATTRLRDLGLSAALPTA